MRIKFVQAKESLKKANPRRQYTKKAIVEFQEHMSEFVDLMASIIEKSYPVDIGEEGCRIEAPHVHEQVMMVELGMLKEWFINTEERMK